MKYTLLIFMVLFALSGRAQEYVYFDLGESNLTSSSKSKLEELFSEIDTLASITLVGHTDTIGTVEDNMILSKNRVQAVKKHLENKYQLSNIEISHKGESEATFSSNEENRRVSIEIIAPNIVETPSPSEPSFSIENFLTEDKIQLNNIMFVPGTPYFLDSNAIYELHHLKNVMDSLETLKIEIAGHVCCVDDQFLSEMRAKMVFDFLVNRGVSTDRLIYRGYSNSQPLVPETSEANNQKNRRVEARIISR